MHQQIKRQTVRIYVNYKHELIFDFGNSKDSNENKRKFIEALDGPIAYKKVYRNRYPIGSDQNSLNRKFSAQRVGFRLPPEVYKHLEKRETHQNGFVSSKTICPKQYPIFFPTDIMQKNFLNICLKQIDKGIVSTKNGQVYIDTIFFNMIYRSSSKYLELEIDLSRRNNSLLFFGYCRDATDYLVPTDITKLLFVYFNLETIDLSGPRYIDVDKLDFDKKVLLIFGYCRNATEYLVPIEIINLIHLVGFSQQKAIEKNPKVKTQNQNTDITMHNVHLRNSNNHVCWIFHPGKSGAIGLIAGGVIGIISGLYFVSSCINGKHIDLSQLSTSNILISIGISCIGLLLGYLIGTAKNNDKLPKLAKLAKLACC